MSIPRNWGARSEELAASYPCDEHLVDHDDVWFRAIDVAAPAETLYRWLCQLTIAPYSYDSLDNFGRRSPQRLIPGREHLKLGQRVMTIFELISFASPHEMTIRMVDRWGLRAFGMFVITYAVRDLGEERSRLVVKCLVKDSPTVVGFLRPRLLVWGDLVMMRRQLLNLSELAERTHAEGAQAPTLA
jgi:hypothetical protein